MTVYYRLSLDVSSPPPRLMALWEQELQACGPQASLRRAVWAFCRTRLLLSIVCLMVTQLAGFSGPVSASHLSPSLSFYPSLTLSPYLSLSL